MPRSAEYQRFLDEQKTPVPVDDLESIASPEEVGWWKQEQVRRAIHAARHSIATPEQLRLLLRHHVPFPKTAVARTKEALRGESFCVQTENGTHNEE